MSDTTEQVWQAPAAVDEGLPPLNVAPDRGRHHGHWALAVTVLLIPLVYLLVFLGRFLPEGRWVGRMAGGVFAVAALGGLALGVRSLGLMVRARPWEFTPLSIVVVLNFGPQLLAIFLGGLLALFGDVPFSRGRQLRRFGQVLLPRLQPDVMWPHLALAVAIPADVVAGLAAQWRENGRNEHASVAAFAQLTQQLMALGAPPALLKAANQDALDEIRHAELCFSLAQALDGKAVGPAPFPEAVLPQRLTLAQLAVSSLHEGALLEGVSARVVARLALVCEVPEIAAILKEIAADEGRHAAHGWHVVQWCVAKGGEPVRRALAKAVLELPKAIHSAMPASAGQGEWQRFGITGHALEAEEFGKARADLVRRVGVLVGELAVA